MLIGVPWYARHVCGKLANAGHSAYVVGGCVRDSILGKEPHDWDVATSASTEQVKRLFDRVISTGEKHGTVTVLLEGEHVEVTTFRADGDYSDGRHPDSVKFGVSLEEDLARRDFTMNAIAYDPIGDKTIDPFDGQEDIWAGMIRAVGDPRERFREDGLRMMRAARFASQLGFRVASDTKRAIKAGLPVLHSVSRERVRDELLKTISGDSEIGLGYMKTTGILASVLPELVPAFDQKQNRHHKYTVWKHTLVTVNATEGDAICKLGALLHDVAKPATAEPKERCPGEYTFNQHDKIGAEMADDICARLKLSNRDRERVVGLVRHHMFSYTPGKTSDKAVRRLVKRVAPILPDLIRLRVGDYIGKGYYVNIDGRLGDIRERCWDTMKKIADGEAAVSTNELAINGHDVMKILDIKPGPEVGRMMNALLERVIDDPSLNDRGKLTNLLREYDRAAE